MGFSVILFQCSRTPTKTAFMIYHDFSQFEGQILGKVRGVQTPPPPPSQPRVSMQSHTFPFYNNNTCWRVKWGGHETYVTLATLS